MVARHLERKTREKHFSTRDRLGEKLVLVGPAGKGKRKRQEKTKKGNAPERKLAVSNMIQPTKEQGGSNGQSQPPSRRKSSNTDGIERKSSDIGDIELKAFQVRLTNRFASSLHTEVRQGEDTSSLGTLFDCINNRNGVFKKKQDVCVHFENEHEGEDKKRRQGKNPHPSPLLLIVRVVTTQPVLQEKTQRIRSKRSECRRKTTPELRSVTKI